MRHTPLLLGALLILASELIFAGLSALIKYLSADVSQVQMIFFRNLFALVPLLPWLVKHRATALNSTKLPLHLLRAATGLSAMFIYFYIISHSNLVNAAMILLLAPFFIPVLAWAWLKQQQNSAGVIAIILGFIGVLICLYADNDSAAISQNLVLLILFGAVLVAISKTVISKMTATESSQRIVFYFTFLSFALSGLLLPFWWKPISWGNLGLLILLGFGAVLGQLMMTKAFALAPATTLGLLSYSSIIFAALFGAIWWQEIPTQQWYVGALVIVVAGSISVVYGAKKLTRSIMPK